MYVFIFFFFKQKTAYEMRISDWSSDVCSSDLISEKIVPAYRKLQAYFSDEYLPHARAGIAITDLPDGADYYTYLAGYYTTTDLTPAQIHDIGLEEVARIRAEMEKLKAQTGFEGTDRKSTRLNSSH